MINPGLEGKVALITGANHGIGAAAALAFSRQGVAVYLTAYRPPAGPSLAGQQDARAGIGGPALYAAMQQRPIEATLGEIARQGGLADGWECDLGDSGNIPRLFDRCEDRFGPVDILVNNHTYCVLETFDPARVTAQGFPVSLVSAAEIDAHFAVNARAFALLMSEYTQRFLRREARWGRIINVSTDAAHAHDANVSYAASKHAIESYSRSAASELGQYGITVNVVAPGPTQTGYISPEAEKELSKITPLRRLGMPEDVADVMVFLASEQARWLTGQLLYAGGGFRMPQ